MPIILLLFKYSCFYYCHDKLPQTREAGRNSTSLLLRFLWFIRPMWVSLDWSQGQGIRATFLPGPEELNSKLAQVIGQINPTPCILGQRSLFCCWPGGKAVFSSQRPCIGVCGGRLHLRTRYDASNLLPAQNISALSFCGISCAFLSTSRPCIIIMGPPTQMSYDFLPVLDTFISVSCSNSPLPCYLICSLKGVGVRLWTSLEVITWATPGDKWPSWSVLEQSFPSAGYSNKELKLTGRDRPPDLMKN